MRDRANNSTISSLLIAVALVTFSFSQARAAQTNIIGPAGSGTFGSTVTVLPNGNFVVIDTGYDLSGPTVTDVGAVHLYDGATLTLISTLTGGRASDLIGNGGITVLTNGNYVVRSSNWDNPSPVIADVGAVTWCSATTGCNGTVSAANSLVGGTAGDNVVGGVTALTNGNYVVRMGYWDNPSPLATDAGSVTWGNGAGGTVGLITASNSLVGGTAGDFVGNNGITALTNGNYVIRSTWWANPSPVIPKVGAVTWGNGTGGTVGLVTASNSLIGGTANDNVGNWGITALTNGNYVVSSPYWDNPSPVILNVGAVTWGSGTGGTVGLVTASNSLIGGTANDAVGGTQTPGGVPVGITALTNGNYVVGSRDWGNPSPFISRVGAVTWGSGTGGTVGLVTSSNSLIGGTANDAVGGTQTPYGVPVGITALTNGNYVVASQNWSNPSPFIGSVGAVTWGNGAGGAVGLVTASNSLVGGRANDQVGNYGITALTNGNYVVRSPYWSNPSPVIFGVGAATWGNGAGGTVGLVTASNSLIGGTAFDQVGGGVTALTNGNYVVSSPAWNKSPAIVDVGAATWGNGATGTVGLITSSNSLIGGSPGDEVGGALDFDDNVSFNGVTALTNGNYVVGSPYWSNPSPVIFGVGAATWGNGAGGTVGLVTASNSLVGGTANDYVGGFYSGEITALTNGSYVVNSRNWDNPSPVIVNASAFTFGNGAYGTNGSITSANSVVGTVSGGTSTFSFDATRNRLFVGRGASNIVSVLTIRVPFDFDGDRRSDISVFRPSDRVWYLNQSTAGFSATQFGLSTDKITPADYDGDGKTDIAVYRDGTWWRLDSSTGAVSATQFGLPGDIPVPADYTGDGRGELAVYRSGTWWMLDLSNNQSSVVQFGISTDKPVVADYDGDGRADQAVYRDGEWHLNQSTQGYAVVQFGLGTDTPVVGDYDGDGKTDLAVYRDGTWYLLQSTNGFTAFQFGIASDIPAPADYDGDGKTDAAVYRDGTWWILQSASGVAAQQFGLANDKPVPAAYLP